MPRLTIAVLVLARLPAALGILQILCCRALIGQPGGGSDAVF